LWYQDGDDEDMSMDASGGGSRRDEDEGWGDEETAKDLRKRERQAEEYVPFLSL
jgi:hypothetical protein